MKMLKILYSWLAKKSQPQDVESFFSIVITNDNDIIIDFFVKDNDPDKMAQLLFLLLSNFMSETVVKSFAQKYDPDFVNEVLQRVTFMASKYKSNNNDDDDDDENPIVDPCHVFKHKENGENYELEE